jgi:hypothetical protein
MSVENTVFAAYARNSGEATKEPATNAATNIPTTFAFIMLSIVGKSYKTGYGITQYGIPLLPRCQLCYSHPF